MINILIFLSITVGIPLLFLPTIIAKKNNHPRFGMIFLTVSGVGLLAAFLKATSIFIFPPIIENGITTPDVTGDMLTYLSIALIVVGWVVCVAWSLIKPTTKQNSET